jgi:hypothetical protein
LATRRRGRLHYDAAEGEITAPSAAALRMRRSRERRRQGDVIVNLEVGPSTTADLADLGWLVEPDYADTDAIVRALTGLVERAIAVRVAPAPSSRGKVSFMLEIQNSTIETLVALRWLRADRRDDIAVIVTAFRGFAGRSLEIARNGGVGR